MPCHAPRVDQWMTKWKQNINNKLAWNCCQCKTLIILFAIIQRMQCMSVDIRHKFKCNKFFTESGFSFEPLKWSLIGIIGIHHNIFPCYNTLNSFLRTRYIEEWSEKKTRVIKICQVVVNSCQEVFFAYIDKILPRSHQDLSWNVGISILKLLFSTMKIETVSFFFCRVILPGLTSEWQNEYKISTINWHEIVVSVRLWSSSLPILNACNVYLLIYDIKLNATNFSLNLGFHLSRSLIGIIRIHHNIIPCYNNVVKSLKKNCDPF